MYNLALPHLLSDVTLPTLVAWGDDDRIVRANVARPVARLKKARLDIVARAGHWIELDQPKALANLTLRHIA
ncbi:MAG: alpha/beta hydrolase [Alphaproteobacteria bacterium]